MHPCLHCSLSRRRFYRQVNLAPSRSRIEKKIGWKVSRVFRRRLWQEHFTARGDAERPGHNVPYENLKECRRRLPTNIVDIVRSKNAVGDRVGCPSNSI